MTKKDKIIGMFLGVYIGDSLGMPVETFSASKIAETYGRVTDYLVPDGHKWFNGHKAGTYTDDTQLTLAVARALMDGDIPYLMSKQVDRHIEAYNKTTAGWGNTTRNAVRNLANNIDWTKSGLSGEGQGTGNGVAMKVAPIGVFCDNFGDEVMIHQFVTCLNAMTHPTSLSLSAALMQVTGVGYCLNHEPLSFNVQEFIDLLISESKQGELYYPETLTDNITDRMIQLKNNYQKATTAQVIEAFGGGSCYCYNSLPFSYYFFLNNPFNINCVYDVVSAGGDTDSNGSIVGALLGALHGTAIFPQHLIDGLVEKDEVLGVAQEFAEKFGE